MEIVSLIKELRENKVAVKLVDNQLEVTLFKEDINPALLEALKAQKQKVIDYLSSISIKASSREIPKIELLDSYPVSNAQLRIWLESQAEKASIAYHMPFEMHLTEAYDISILEQAIQYLIDRHEILRTVFRLDGNKELRQYIIPPEELRFRLDYQDFCNNPEGKKQAQAYIKAQVTIPFDLAQGLLIKACVLQYKADGYILFFNMHHIICDAWSIPVLKQEFLIVYKSLLAGEIPELPALRIQYKDYASWHVNRLRSELLAEQKQYWRNQFLDEIPVLEFPQKNIRPPIKTYNGQILGTYFGKELTELVHAYQREQGGSLFMVVLSILYVMLSRYTGVHDIVVGCPFAAREHVELKNQIGFYTNTLAIRNQLEKPDTFDHFFSKVKQSVLDAFTHQQYPFDQLVEDLNLKKDLSRNPLFDVMLVVLPDGSTGEGEILETGANTIVRGESTTSKFDLLIYIKETGKDISFKIEYNTDLFEESLIGQFIKHYKKMIALLLQQPGKKIAGINYLSEEVVRNTGINHKNYQPTTVISLFEKQVEQTPDAVAVCFEDTFLSYRQLNEQVNRVAFYLRSQHQQTRGINVGVMLYRSHFNVIAMLGVIKSGACYVPIDAKYHEDRRQYIINDAEIASIISTTDVQEHFSMGEAKVIHLDTFDFSEWKAENPIVENTLDDAAFIIYTSGSTGNPKGVIQTHRMLSNLIQWNIYDAGIPSGLKHLQYTSFSFDVSLQDCWFVLSGGGTLYITSESLKIDFQKLFLYIVEKGVEVLSFPFSALSNFFEFVGEVFNQKHKLKHIISSGEQLTIGKAMEKFLSGSPAVKLHNHYGPSETHVVTSYTLSAKENNLPKYVPIGKPVANTTIYLLDENLQPVPEKVIGEIYVGGEHLAVGYVKLPELTKERFIVNPFDDEKRLYKTGDLGYKDANGIITYLGRNDNQVKIRGYRIELAEIKNTLLTQEGIQQAYVGIVERDNEKAIVAYVSGEKSSDRQFIKKELSKQLPEYMVPAYIVALNYIPLTPNGKIDVSKLPDVGEEALVKAVYLEAKTEIEKTLLGIWEEILGISSIGILDNFFELGGHSLQITRMLYEINKAFDINLQMKNVFSSQCVQELAQLIADEIAFKKGIATDQTEEIIANKKSEIWEI